MEQNITSNYDALRVAELVMLTYSKSSNNIFY